MSGPLQFVTSLSQSIRVMNVESSHGDDSLPVSQWQEIDSICDRFEAAWKDGLTPRVDDYLCDMPQAAQYELRRELEKIDHEYRVSLGEQTIPDQFVRQLIDSGALTGEQLRALRDDPPAGRSIDDVPGIASELCRLGILTEFQAQVAYRGLAQRLAVGAYIVMDAIGRGGMGYVYKARHREMNRIVALKTLPKEARQSRDAVRRFEREIETLGQLSHPNIVAAHDAFQANGARFLVMEYISGVGLPSLIREHGPLSVPQAVCWTLQAARGLDYAHRQGIIHRDVKPTNLLCDGEGTVKVLDLGLVRICDAKAAAGVADRELTNCDQPVGTADYMSPEQALDPRQADARSDIYSLGCTLYYLLTGRAPFGGNTWAQKILEHRDRPIPSLRESREDVPEQLDALFRRMLAKRPAERPQTMHEVIAALNELSLPMPPSLVPDRSANVAGDQLQDTVRAHANPVSDTVVDLNANLDLDSPLFCDTAEQFERSHLRTRLPAGTGLRHRTRWAIALATTVAVAILLVFVLGLGLPGGDSPGDIKFLDPLDGVVDDDFLACLEDFTQPVYLDLSGQPITDQGLRYLVKANVVGLILKGTSIGDDGLRHLRDSEHLKVLNLADTRVTDDGLEHLSRLRKIETLDLSGTSVNGSGLRHLEQVTSLKTLILAGTELTDAGCKSVGRLSSLDSLDVRHTDISDEGMKQLATGLPGCDIQADSSLSSTEAPISQRPPAAEH
jgi:serine/threonine protein kinase